MGNFLAFSEKKERVPVHIKYITRSIRDLRKKWRTAEPPQSGWCDEPMQFYSTFLRNKKNYHFIHITKSNCQDLRWENYGPYVGYRFDFAKIKSGRLSETKFDDVYLFSDEQITIFGKTSQQSERPSDSVVLEHRALDGKKRWKTLKAVREIKNKLNMSHDIDVDIEHVDVELDNAKKVVNLKTCELAELHAERQELQAKIQNMYVNNSALNFRG